MNNNNSQCIIISNNIFDNNMTALNFSCMVNICMIYCMLRSHVSGLSHLLPVVLYNSHEPFSKVEHQEFYDCIATRIRLLSPTSYANATERCNNPLTHEKIPAGVTMMHMHRLICRHLVSDVLRQQKSALHAPIITTVILLISLDYVAMMKVVTLRLTCAMTLSQPRHRIRFSRFKIYCKFIS